MALIVEIDCKSCGFTSSSFTDGLLKARREDGTEVELPHPAEYQTALEETGKSLAELDDEDRLEVRTALFCQACGAVNYGGDPEATCPDCRMGGMLFPHEQVQNGLLERLGRYLGLLSEPDEPTCPECDAVSLHWKAVAQS